MKNSLRKVILAVIMVTAPLVASEYAFQTDSLFAIEGGGSNIGVEHTGGVYDETSIANIGLKIGAQTESYRVFLSARYYDADNLSTLNTYGGEVQYLFNFSKPVNFYLGANAGVANVKIAIPGDPSESASEMYYGADAGFNIHATELIDVEIGARYLALQEDVVSTSGATVDGIVTAYASVIIKWKMD